MAEREAAAALATSAGDVKLQRGHSAKEELRKKLKAKPTSAEDNAKAADALKLQLLSDRSNSIAAIADQEEDSATSKRKASEISANPEDVIEMFGADDDDDDDDDAVAVDIDDDDVEEDSEEDEAAMDAAKKNIKEKIKEIETAKLDDFAKNVKDNVRLHEPGWKVSANLFVAEYCTHFGLQRLIRSHLLLFV
jgi:hypothetical protein